MNPTYIKDVLLQQDKSYFIMEMIKYVEAHEARSHWKLMKNSEVNNMKINKYGNIKTILSIWSFKRKMFPDGRLTKQKYRLCAHGGMQQWGVK